MTFKPTSYQLKEVEKHTYNFTVHVVNLNLIGTIGHKLYLFTFMLNDQLHLCVQGVNDRIRHQLAFTSRDGQPLYQQELITRVISYWIETQAPWDDVERETHLTI